MNIKLTLTIEQEIVEKAKHYAKTNERSLSDLIENYLKMLVKNDEKEVDLTPVVKSLKGSFKDPQQMNYKDSLVNILTEKHLSK